MEGVSRNGVFSVHSMVIYETKKFITVTMNPVTDHQVPIKVNLCPSNMLLKDSIYYCH
jgi:hypothetical protein